MPVLRAHAIALNVTFDRPMTPDAAREILAKHDENYMPPEVAKALKESGQWKDKK